MTYKERGEFANTLKVISKREKKKKKIKEKTILKSYK